MAEASVSNLIKRVFPFLKYFFALKDITVVLFVVSIIAIIIVPLPSWLLDLFLTISLSIATLIILISIFVSRPTDFTTYPTLILLVTLFRLALNIATTRMILAEGHNGPEAVSAIITSFGNFVVSGNYVIGVIVFAILVIVNFLVITNGSTRVAEVSARFTLDALPGKQMAIDADLNSGLIDQHEARRRREELASETSFYGAMDGSSKFVKGDAVAGIIITVVNIVGGILIGTFQNGLSISDSASTYTLLTVGDGLVGQIPALLISTATGIIITRASKDDSTNFASGLINQLGRDYKVLFIVGAILLLFASVPGLPTLSLGLVGLIFLLMSVFIRNSHDGFFSNWLRARSPLFAEITGGQAAAPKSKAKQTGKDQAGAPKVKEKTPDELKAEEEKVLDDILKVELLQLDMGYQLIRLADKREGGELLDRVRTMRRSIASEYGFLMPQVRICDNLQLDPNTYEIKLKGVVSGAGQVYPGQFLAMNTGLASEPIDGTPTKEPAFGLAATWIHPNKKQEATIKGYTIVDPDTIITTHLKEMVKKFAEEMLTRQDVQKLLDSLRKDYPAVVDETLKVVSIGQVQQVLKELLHEKIPVKDMLTIAETIADAGLYTKSIEILTEQVRHRLSRTISNLYKNEQGSVRIVTLDPKTTQRMLDKTKEQNGTREIQLSVREADSLVKASRATKNDLLTKGITQFVFVVDPVIRKPLAKLYERFAEDITVLSEAELESGARFEIVGSVAMDEG